MDLFSMQLLFQTNTVVEYVHKMVETIKDHLWTWSCGCSFDVLYPVGCKYEQACT